MPRIPVRLLSLNPTDPGLARACPGYFVHARLPRTGAWAPPSPKLRSAAAEPRSYQQQRAERPLPAARVPTVPDGVVLLSCAGRITSDVAGQGRGDERWMGDSFQLFCAYYYVCDSSSCSSSFSSSSSFPSCLSYIRSSEPTAHPLAVGGRGSVVVVVCATYLGNRTWVVRVHG